MNAALPDLENRERLLAAPRRATLVLIGVFWLFTVAMLSIRGELVDSPPLLVMTPRRLAIAACGVLLCLAMVFVFERLRGRSFPERIAWGVAGALVMALSLTMFAALITRVALPVSGLPPFGWGEFAQWTMIWLGYSLAWISAHLALTYHWETLEQRRQMLVMNALANEARVAALRYQINPHFLFNTLNSISALVIDRRNPEAETMLLNLSTFLRSTLDADTSGTIALEQEIALQRLYLSIEEARFSERMRVEIHVPDALASARVPALILQPLVENAIRYGVGPSEALTTIGISAETRDSELRLIVENDAAPAEAAPAGGGLGLVNVRERLHAHYGARGRLTAGRLPNGGFRAEISLPRTARP